MERKVIDKVFNKFIKRLSNIVAGYEEYFPVSGITLTGGYTFKIGQDLSIPLRYIDIQEKNGIIYILMNNYDYNLNYLLKELWNNEEVIGRLLECIGKVIDNKEGSYGIGKAEDIIILYSKGYTIDEIYHRFKGAIKLSFIKEIVVDYTKNLIDKYEDIIVQSYTDDPCLEDFVRAEKLGLSLADLERIKRKLKIRSKDFLIPAILEYIDKNDCIYLNDILQKFNGVAKATISKLLEDLVNQDKLEKIEVYKKR